MNTCLSVFSVNHGNRVRNRQGRVLPSTMIVGAYFMPELGSGHILCEEIINAFVMFAFRIYVPHALRFH